jgi:hypothetical protein
MKTTLGIAALLSSAGFALAGGPTLEVSPSNMQGWFTAISTDGVNPASASAGFVNGPATPPLGTGSAQLNVGAFGGGAARFRTSQYGGVLLGTITELGYSTYTQATQTPGLAPYLQLRLDYNNDGVQDDILHFEPEYQNGYTMNVPTQADSQSGVWQSWDALAGGWWSVFNTLGTAAAGGSVRPLSDFVANQPLAKLMPTTGLSVTAGFGAPSWNNYIGNFDAVTVGVSGLSTTYNFEVPAPGAGALLAMGGLLAARRRRN